MGVCGIPVHHGRLLFVKGITRAAKGLGVKAGSRAGTQATRSAGVYELGAMRRVCDMGAFRPNCGQRIKGRKRRTQRGQLFYGGVTSCWMVTGHVAA